MRVSVRRADEAVAVVSPSLAGMPESGEPDLPSLAATCRRLQRLRVDCVDLDVPSPLALVLVVATCAAESVSFNFTKIEWK